MNGLAKDDRFARTRSKSIDETVSVPGHVLSLLAPSRVVSKKNSHKHEERMLFVCASCLILLYFVIN